MRHCSRRRTARGPTLLGEGGKECPMTVARFPQHTKYHETHLSKWNGQGRPVMSSSSSL